MPAGSELNEGLGRRNFSGSGNKGGTDYDEGRANDRISAKFANKSGCNEG